MQFITFYIVLLCVLNGKILSVVMLNFAILSVCMPCITFLHFELCVILLNDIMLSIAMLSFVTECQYAVYHIFMLLRSVLLC